MGARVWAGRNGGEEMVWGGSLERVGAGDVWCTGGGKGWKGRWELILTHFHHELHDRAVEEEVVGQIAIS